MSRAYMADVIQESASTTQTVAKKTANDLLAAIADALKTDGRFSLPGFGTFVVRETKARKGLNPRTGKPIKIEAGRTVRFKPAKALKSFV